MEDVDELLVGDLAGVSVVDDVKHIAEFTASRRELCTVSYTSLLRCDTLHKINHTSLLHRETLHTVSHTSLLRRDIT